MSSHLRLTGGGDINASHDEGMGLLARKVNARKVNAIGVNSLIVAICLLMMTILDHWSGSGWAIVL